RSFQAVDCESVSKSGEQLPTALFAPSDGAENGSVAADRRPRVSVYEGDSVEVFGRPAELGRPGGAAVRGAHNGSGADSVAAHRGPGVGVHERKSAERVDAAA